MKKIIIILTFLCVAIGNAQIVNIPDANFKNALLNHNPIIDVNGDGEIQISEAINSPNVLWLVNKNISDLTGIEEFVNIIDLNIWNNQLTSLDVSNNINLRGFNCDNNSISNLDLSNRIMNGLVSCRNNSLTNLNLNNSSINHFDCEINNLSQIDIENASFGFLNVGYNEFVNLDCSQTEIILIRCYNNPNLKYINLRNGFQEIGDESFTNLPVLETVCVDSNDSFIISIILAEVNHTVTITEDCSVLSINQNNLINFSIYPNPSKGFINVDSKTSIAQIKIFNNIGQQIFSKEYTNNLKAINISNLESGIYFIQLFNENGSISVNKIIKQ